MTSPRRLLPGPQGRSRLSLRPTRPLSVPPATAGKVIDLPGRGVPPGPDRTPLLCRVPDISNLSLCYSSAIGGYLKLRWRWFLSRSSPAQSGVFWGVGYRQLGPLRSPSGGFTEKMGAPWRGCLGCVPGGDRESLTQAGPGARGWRSGSV